MSQATKGAYAYEAKLAARLEKGAGVGVNKAGEALPQMRTISGHYHGVNGIDLIGREAGENGKLWLLEVSQASTIKQMGSEMSEKWIEDRVGRLLRTRFDELKEFTGIADREELRQALMNARRAVLVPQKTKVSGITETGLDRAKDIFFFRPE